MAKRRLIIRHKWALGDTVLLTALVRDIHKAHPGKYDIRVDTHFTNVWWNNPYVTKFTEKTIPSPTKVEVSWADAIRWNGYARYGDSREKKHILAWYHYDFEKKTGIKVPVTEPKPDLHLSANEKEEIISGRYWVVVSGGKLDLTTKHWQAERMQEVVNKLGYLGINCVQVGAVHTNHIHPPLSGVTNMIGKTENARDLFNVIMHSEGVICGVTAAMHIAAAFDKPCVVYAGGREEPWFEAYVDDYKAFGKNARPIQVPHKFLHTIGLLDCCDVQGCWKKRVVPLDPSDLSRNVGTLCRKPIKEEGSHAIAHCQYLITSDHVVEAVMDYYEKGILPPIDLDKVKSFLIPELKPKEIKIPNVSLIEVEKGEAVKTSLEYDNRNVSVIREPSVPAVPQKIYQTKHPLPITEKMTGRVSRKLGCMDNSIIGGKITVCVLCYGPHTDLAKKCLSSLISSLPPERMDLRVAVNKAEPATVDYLETLPITKKYIHSENKYKYPVMRKMFWDEDTPITTKYVLWLDDDTWIVKPTWINELCTEITNFHPYGYRMFGNLMYHDLAIYKDGLNPTKWFKAADWYRGRNFRSRGGSAETPNGSVIDFAVGWCWAIALEAIKQANIPDIRLNHNGGDITIGEQIHQAGFHIRQWNKGKSLVACPSKAEGGRRGYSERFPWDPKK